MCSREPRGRAEEARLYWSRRAPSYDESPWHTCCPGVWRRLLSAVLPLGRRALDLGTGTGFIASILVGMGYSHVIGVDVSPEMLSRARAKLWGTAGHLVDLVEADAAWLPLRSGAVDALFARHVLWALHDPWTALREAARCAEVAAFTFSTRSSPPRTVDGVPSTPLRWVASPDDVLRVAQEAGVRARMVEASWVRVEQSRETGGLPEGETGYYVLLVERVSGSVSSR